MSLYERISNPSEYLSKPKKEITEWKFGDIFVNSSVVPLRPDTLRLSIILETGGSDSFGAHTIRKDSIKEAISPIGGSGETNEIIEIIDHWDLPRILNAYTEGCRLANAKPSANVLELLNQESKKPPYFVKRSS